MAILIAMCHGPVDPAAFDRRYFDTRVPLARRRPGLRHPQGTRGTASASPYHLITTSTLDSVACVQAALASDTGRAIIANLASFADAGAEVLIADSATG